MTSLATLRQFADLTAAIDHFKSHSADDYHHYPITAQDLAQLEISLGFALPAPLQAFILQQGSYYWGLNENPAPQELPNCYAIHASCADLPDPCNLYQILSLQLRLSELHEPDALHPYRDALRFSYYCYAHLQFQQGSTRCTRYFYLNHAGAMDSFEIAELADFDLDACLQALATPAALAFASQRYQALQQHAASAGEPQHLQKTPDFFARLAGLQQHQAESLVYYEASSYKLEHLSEEVGFNAPAAICAFWQKHGAMQIKQPLEDTEQRRLLSFQVLFPGIFLFLGDFHLHRFLTTISPDCRIYGPDFINEADYLNRCFYVYGMLQEQLGELIYCELFFFDNAGDYHSLRFKNLEGVDLSGEIEALLALKPRLLACSNASVAACLSNSTTATELSQPDYLNHYGLEKISYQEACARLGVSELFGAASSAVHHEHDPDQHDEEDEDDDDENPNWAELCHEVFYHEGDLHITENFRVPDCWSSYCTLVVKGNLRVSGCLSSHYHVTGNTSIDWLILQDGQYTAGSEVVNYLAEASAEDHEVVRWLNQRTLDTPYLFSWFINLNSFELRQPCTIFALYNYDDLADYEASLPPQHTLFSWHDYAYALKDGLYYRIEQDYHDGQTWSTEAIYQRLKNGESILQDDFNRQALPEFKRGMQLRAEDDFAAAFYHFHQACLLWPSYSPAQLQAGLCLKLAGDYQQALAYFARAFACFPKGLAYPDLNCLNQAALCCLALQDYAGASHYAELALARHEDNAFGLRVQAELAWRAADNSRAIDLLKRSIKADSFYSNHWLLGLIYFQQGRTDLAEAQYKIARRHSSNAKAYQQSQDPAAMYAPAQHVNWLAQLHAPAPQLKDQAYWDNYHARRKQQVCWGIPDYLRQIPLEFRSLAMLQDLLALQNEAAEKTISGSILAEFSSALIEREHVYAALERSTPAQLADIPGHLLEAQMYPLIQYLELAQVPAEIKDYAFYRLMCEKTCSYFQEVPAAWRDQDMYVSAIIGGALSEYSSVALPQAMQSDAILAQVITRNIKALSEIPARRMNQALYQHACSCYADHPAWPELLAQHGREGWRNQTYRTQFDYKTLDYVWACFWDEAWLLDLFSLSEKNARPRLYQLPAHYISAALARQAVSNSSYDLEFVPRELINAELCEIACSRDYGSALEHVPLALRSEKVCQLAIQRGFDNFRYVPAALRSVELCIQAYKKDSRQLHGIPYHHYVSVFDYFFKRSKTPVEKARFRYYRGLGHFNAENYQTAQKEASAALAYDDLPDYLRAQLHFLQGWCHHRQQQRNEARACLQLARAADEGSVRELGGNFEKASLPPVIYAVHDFSKAEFDGYMKETERCYQAEDYHAGLEQLARAQHLLEQSVCSDMAFWAYLWDHQRYGLYETAQFEAWRALCEHAEQRLSSLDLWAYLEQHNPIRACLRNLYHAKAYELWQQAESLADLKRALEFSKRCLSTIAPIENKDVLHPFYATQALILRAAARHDDNYHADFTKLWKKMEKLNLINDELHASLQS